VILLLCDTLLNRLGWYIKKDREWIPAYAESTPRIGIKCSGGMTEFGGNDGLTILSSSRMRGPIRRGKDKGWIPAYAESTPRIGIKCSGGNDGVVMRLPPLAVR